MEEGQTNKLKLFLENFFIYGLSNVLNKLVPLIMLPIMTRLLPDPTVYAKFDTVSIIVSITCSIAILGTYDATFREYFEHDDVQYRKRITSTALGIVLLSSSFIAIILCLFSAEFSRMFFGNTSDSPLIILCAVCLVLSAPANPLRTPTRIKNERRVYGLSSIANTIIAYILSISAILMGYSYWGMIGATIITDALIILFFAIHNRAHFSIKLFDKKIARELLKIGLPLMPTFIVFWVFSSLDRIMITHIMGQVYTGIYAAGAKLASVSQFIQVAVGGGWQYFSFSSMKEEGHTEMVSNIFQWLAAISFFVFALACLVYKPIFGLFFTGSYAAGYTVFPFLFLSPLLLILIEMLSSQFVIIKKSYMSTLCLSFGAVFNIISNYVMIPSFGIKGAAFTTFCGYVISLVLLLFLAKRKGIIYITPKFVALLVLVFLLALYIFLVDGIIITVAFTILLMGVIVLLYRKDFGLLLSSMKGLLKKRG